MRRLSTGKIIASCGHELSSVDEGEVVRYREWDIGFEGSYPTVVYAHYCPTCAARLKRTSAYLPSDEAADEWLSRNTPF